MPREPRIGALAAGLLLGMEIPAIKEKFTDTEWQLYQPMLAAPALQTSSMGRLFDAVASLVLGIDKTSYEGEAAMLLEAAARPDSGLASAPATTSDYKFPLESFQADLFRAILRDLENSVSSREIALKFHYSLVNLIRQEAEKLGVMKLAFSGGVFQNSLLVELILKELGTDFDLYFHKQLSPNDENISFGQLAWYTMHENQLSQ
jgi:hydrogenase maturation protein HypF